MKPSYLCLLLSAGLAHAADEPTKLGDELAAFSEKLLAAVKPIKDEKTAKAALPTLDELAPAQAKLMKALRALPREKALGVAKKAEAAMKAAGEEMTRVERLPAAYAVLKGNAIVKARREANEAVARIRAKDLAAKAEIYYIKHASYPASIDALAEKQPDGGEPLVPREALLDPWGAKYKFAVEVDGKGVERVVVSTTPPGGKRVTNLDAVGPAKILPPKD